MAIHPLSALALAAGTLTAPFSGTAAAQGAAPTTGADAPQAITVSGFNAANAASVAGFGDVPLSRAPWSATVITTSQLADAGIGALGDITRLDAAATDAYNPPGYWSKLAVRGFTLDNRFNYRRDGLPINAETVLATGNKAALEILKGASGIQAGTSAPGGLVNLVVKRPTGRVRAGLLQLTQPGTLQAALDLGDRAGADGALGWRINAGLTRLDPSKQHSRGHAALAALAVDARLGRGTLLEAELETSRQSQPSTPGFSLLGDQLPDTGSVDPDLNLNNQPWSLPVVMDGRTGSMRLTQALGTDTQLVVHAMRQGLTSQDRVAFPFGCSSENDFSRFCRDGSFDLYDFRSENERRTTDALDTSADGRLTLAGMSHRWRAGVLLSRHRAQFQRQAYNWVGVGQVDGSAVTAADPSLTDDNTNRRERSAELHLQDAVTLSPDWQLWAGLRHSRLQRHSVRTDGSRATDYHQSFTTPWLALSHAVAPGSLLYASWGQGVESEVAPERARYANRGQPLPALKSRQLELGAKHRSPTLNASAALFDIQRPQWEDIDTATGRPAADCSDAAPCLRRADGTAHHQGIEAEAEARLGPVSLRGSAQWLRARREGSSDTARNGLQPTNVPARSLKLQAAYNLPQLPGLALMAFVSHESSRMVLPDNRTHTPGWTRTDLAARYTQPLGHGKLVWRAGIDNLFNQRAWKEAPYEFSHAWLYPMAPRTWHASVQWSL